MIINSINGSFVNYNLIINFDIKALVTKLKVLSEFNNHYPAHLLIILFALC